MKTWKFSFYEMECSLFIVTVITVNSERQEKQLMSGCHFLHCSWQVWCILHVLSFPKGMFSIVFSPHFSSIIFSRWVGHMFFLLPPWFGKNEGWFWTLGNTLWILSRKILGCFLLFFFSVKERWVEEKALLTVCAAWSIFVLAVGSL